MLTGELKDNLLEKAMDVVEASVGGRSAEGTALAFFPLIELAYMEGRESVFKEKQTKEK